MTQLGRRLAILGLILMGVTMLVLGRQIERALQTRCVAIVPLTVSKEAVSEAVLVERSCQVAFDLRIVAVPAAERADGGAPGLRYSFPFTCAALDGSGQVLFSEEGVLRWDHATRIVRHESDGRARVQHNLSGFATPTPATVRVLARLAADTTYHAELTEGELKLYDNLVRPRDEMIVAGVALLFGPAVMIVGVVLAVAGWLKARRQAEEEGDTRTDTD